MSDAKRRDEMPAEGNFDIFEPGGPEGFDPESKGRVPLTPGWYMVQITDYAIAQDTEFKYKDDRCILDQLRPTLTVCEGAGEGGQVTDFLPLPPRMGQEQPIKEIANQWACFARCAGFTMSKTTMIPGEWTEAIKNKKNPYETLMNRKLWVRLVPQMDQDGQPKTNREGDPWMKPAFFGYRSIADGSLKPVEASTAAPSKRASRKPPVAAADIDL